ncbi:EamA family transporter [Nonomuraea rubra]|uniref:EamA family transporter n=1 Tax=Nonomuraea rubra TaxID=46180 RepID=UPI003618EA76
MRYAGLALAFGASSCFAFSGPMAKYLDAAGLTPIEAVWARMAGAGLLLVAVLAVVRPGALRIRRSRVPFVGLYAVVAVAGLGMVAEVWQEIRLDVLGLALGLLAAACSAGYFLMNDSFDDDLDPLGLIAWGMAGAVVVLTPFARPWDLPWEAFTVSVTPSADGLELPVAVAYLWMVVVATVVAYILGVSAVRRLSAAVGATVASLGVIGGAVVAWGLVGETLGGFQIAGGMIVLSGALLAQTATRSRTPPVPPLPDVSPAAR